MANSKVSKDKITVINPSLITQSSEERLELLANLIVDHILEDQQNDSLLLNKIEAQDYGKLITS